MKESRIRKQILALLVFSLVITGCFSVLVHPTEVSAATKADSIISTGLKYKGVPYKFGAKAGSGYLDCSLFVQTVFKKNGIKLPRNSRQQYNAVKKIKRSQLKKGDLVFFNVHSRQVDHVAIYMGNNKLLHTYKKGIGVTVTSFNSYWSKNYYGAGRAI